jgi:hypothetical protein
MSASSYVSIVRNHHELGECRPPEECVVCLFEIGYIKLHVLGLDVFPSLEGHRKSDLVNRGRHYFRDHSMEGSPAWMQCQSGESHLVKGLQKQDVQRASPIDKDSVELDILDDGADNHRVLT